jgi:hypothetical protein
MRIGVTRLLLYHVPLALRSMRRTTKDRHDGEF